MKTKLKITGKVPISLKNVIDEKSLRIFFFICESFFTFSMSTQVLFELFSI